MDVTPGQGVDWAAVAQVGRAELGGEPGERHEADVGDAVTPAQQATQAEADVGPGDHDRGRRERILAPLGGEDNSATPSEAPNDARWMPRLVIDNG